MGVFIQETQQQLVVYYSHSTDYPNNKKKPNFSGSSENIIRSSNQAEEEKN